jgi:hypothetical protein
MTISRLTCPECAAVLKPARPVPGGARVKCPKCGASFTAGAGVEDDPNKTRAYPAEDPKPRTAPAAPKARAAPTRAAPASAKGDDPKPAPKPAAKKPAKAAEEALEPEFLPLEEEEEGALPAPKPAPKPTAKKPAKAAEEALEPEFVPEEDDEEGTYAVTRDPDEEAEAQAAQARGAEPRKKKPKIDYAPDMSIKDLRGPAVEALVTPTNCLLGTGLVGFIGWLVLLILILIPALFPLEDDAGEKDKPKEAFKVGKGLGLVGDQGDVVANAEQMKKDADPKADEEKKSFIVVYGWDLAVLAGYEWYLFIVMLSPIFVGMAYSALIAFGAVKAQNIESREWGFVSSIMAMLPINSAGFIAVTLILIDIPLGMIFDAVADADMLRTIDGAWVIIVTLVGAAMGVIGLIALLKPEVKKGFEYKAE